VSDVSDAGATGPQLNEERPTAEDMVVTVDQHAPEDPLTPELVLVLPPELRAAALAQLPPPTWPKAPPRVAVSPSRAQESPTRIFVTVLLSRAAQLMLIFFSVTALVLTLAAVANAVR
jgi:hypothetical protein